jgi:hypothetical protein
VKPPITSDPNRRVLSFQERRVLPSGKKAKSVCDRALERMVAEPAEPVTEEVDAFALAAILGMSIQEAELFVLDARFPNEPSAC